LSTLEEIVKEQLVLNSHQSFCTCLHILFQGEGGQRFLAFVVIVAKTNLASWFQVSKATKVGEVFLTSPILAILLCLLFVVFSLIGVIFYINFTKHCQTFDEMKLFDFLISSLQFYSKARVLGDLEGTTKNSKFIYLFIPSVELQTLNLNLVFLKDLKSCLLLFFHKFSSC
jgi:hypothetical protein